MGAIAFGIFNFNLVARAEILPVVHISDENSQVLRSETKKVTTFDDSLRKLIDDMKDTMSSENNEQSEGVGLAAPQIGKDLKIFVVKLDSGFQEFINPEMLEQSEEKSISVEGCISVPDLIGMVKRSNNVKIQALNKNGEKFVLELSGFDAYVVSHELDHLNKILFTDVAEAVVDIKGLDETQIQTKVLEALMQIMNKK